MAASLTYIHPFTLSWVLQLVIISGINALFKSVSHLRLFVRMFVLSSQIICKNVCLISGVLLAQIHHTTLCAVGHGGRVRGQMAPQAKSGFILGYSW